MELLGFEKVSLDGGFWKKRYEINKNATLPAVYERFDESGRIGAFRCLYKEGDENPPHYYWDSDVAKWMEAAAYTLKKEPSPELEEKIDDIVAQIEKNASEDGYFNSYFLTVEPTKRFTDRHKHELYCAGHLMEAAVAYNEATGKDVFLKAMEKYADLIEKVFVKEQSAAFVTPGHEEIELALVKMYKATGKKKYLDLSKFFIDKRGCSEKEKATNGEDIQSSVPVRKQKEAVGHAVRATYLYSAMADLALLTDDKELKEVCFDLFYDIANKKIFVTGGIGSNSRGEAFAPAYYLPNINAYSETCAAIGLVFFAERMQRLKTDSKFADLVERVICNGGLSGVSLDGESFFYENPLAIEPRLGKLNNMHRPIAQRVKIFSCSCCPPNVARFFASIGNLAYGEENGVIYIRQFFDSTLKTEINGEQITLTQRTDFPLSGAIKLEADRDCRIAVRIPGWTSEYQSEKSGDGYMYLDLKKDSPIELDLKPEFYFVNSDPRVTENLGKAALMRGPVVYCLEGIDNGGDLDGVLVDTASPVKTSSLTVSLPAAVCEGERVLPGKDLYERLDQKKTKKAKLTFIPYHAFANRGETAMRVWVDTVR
ncbi:MAG: glycoside hydrolase family 127 protein [Clostridia bacterium]|nr:glycoside hydrolase family 127 protein [Clostridia bacterium]